MVTGHIPDFYCGEPNVQLPATQCGFVRTAVSYARGGAPNPTLPVLVITRHQNRLATAITRAFDPGIAFQVVDPRSTEFTSLPIATATYSAIAVASDSTCDGCDLNVGSAVDSAALLDRAPDILAFFNAGGGVYANAGASRGDGDLTIPDVYYTFLPEPLAGGPVDSESPFSLTAAGMALGLQPADILERAPNSFAEPGSGSFLQVAERDLQGRALTLFGEKDTVPPALSLPGNLTVEAAGPGGAAVTYAASATDAVAGPVTPICAPASGSTFPLGLRQVSCTATDPSGNVASGGFTVTVLDTRPPVLTLPPEVTAEQGSPLAFTATGTDLVDGPVVPGCSPAAGAPVPPGTTLVSCTARDRAGNQATGSFTLTGRPPPSPPPTPPPPLPPPPPPTPPPPAGPRLDSFTPARTAPGGQLVIRGAAFGRLQGASTITVGGVPAAVDSWSATRIVIFAPSGTPGVVSVELSIGASTLTGPLTLLPAVQHAPEANIIAIPQLTPGGLTVIFDATLSVDPDLLTSGAAVSAEKGEQQLSAGLSVSWSFGDGASSKRAVVAHTYSRPGDYSVKLTVTDRSNRTATVTQQVSVGPPVQTVVRTVAGVRRTVTIRRVPVFRPVNIRIPSQIVFDFGAARLRPESRAYLLRVARVVRRSSKMTRVAGYTDSIGSAGFNLVLSRERAKRVRVFLAQRGRVKARLLRAVGFGEGRPLASNRSEAGRQRNRRVVLTVQLRVGTRRI